MVKFCPRCGAIMQPKKINGEIYLVCPRCGYKVKATDKDLESYHIKTRIKHTVKEKTTVITEKDIVEGLPITRDVTCPRCGYHEAYYWVVQTRSADEPPTRFYKCRRCGYVWREYE
jgi:DNA-directed RNA polymerase subunit M